MQKLDGTQRLRTLIIARRWSLTEMSSAVTVAMTADDDAVAVKSHFLSARRSRRFLFALLTPIIFTCSATIFGFPAVADALRRSGEYEELCPTGKSMPCAEQSLFFGKVYVIIA